MDDDHQECPRDRNTADKECTLHDYTEEQGCPCHAMDVRAVDDLLPQAQSCPLMLMLHASNQQSLCSCFAWIRNGMLRSGEMTTSCPRSCTNKKSFNFRGGNSRQRRRGGQRGRRDAGFAPDDKLDTRELINVSGARRVPLHPSTA